MAQLILNDQLQNGTSATLNNHTVTNMQLLKSHTWTGRFSTQPPQVITSHGGVARFTHLKGVQGGSRAGVMYTITGTGGAAQAVVLAWDAPANFNATTSPNKLFGICGPKDVIEALTWESIGKQLDKAGSSFVYNDEVTKISVHANIMINPRTNMADLFANFLLMP